jgi:hypothetical protein
MTKIEHKDGSTVRDEKKGTGNTDGVLWPERMLCFSEALSDRAVSRCQSPFSLRNPGTDYAFFRSCAPRGNAYGLDSLSRF